MKAFALCAMLALLPRPASSETFVGQASIVDGDTIDIHGERIRLNGIDAPESRQLCRDGADKDYRCGQVAAKALDEWIGDAVVWCEPSGIDRYRRIIATCTARGEDIGRWLVANGHALAFRRYSLEYLPDEAAAERANAGIWQGYFVPPWDWRKDVR